MRGLTVVFIATTVVAASQAMTTIIAPIAETSTTSSPSTTTIDLLLERRIDSEINRLTRILQGRVRGLQMSSGRLDRHIASLQRALDYNNAVLAQLPELIKNILITNPNRRLSSRTILRMMAMQQNEMSSAESAEVEDRRRRDIFGVTSSIVVVQGTTGSTVTTQMPEMTTQAVETTTAMETTTGMETTVAPEVTSSIATEATTEMTTQAVETTTEMETTAAPEVTSPIATESTTEMTTQELETTTEMETTVAPEVTSTPTESTTEMTTQGTTLPTFLIRRINAVLSRIGRFFQRRAQRLQRSLSRLSRFRPFYRRLIDENTSALNNLPLLVRDLVTSPFQRRLRLSQVFAALRLRLANTTTPSQPDVSPVPARKRRQAESAEVEDDLVGDIEDLKELEQEVREALEEVETLED